MPEDTMPEKAPMAEKNNRTNSSASESTSSASESTSSASESTSSASESTSFVYESTLSPGSTLSPSESTSSASESSSPSRYILQSTNHPRLNQSSESHLSRTDSNPLQSQVASTSYDRAIIGPIVDEYYVLQSIPRPSSQSPSVVRPFHGTNVAPHPSAAQQYSYVVPHPSSLIDPSTAPVFNSSSLTPRNSSHGPSVDPLEPLSLPSNPSLSHGPSEDPIFDTSFLNSFSSSLPNSIDPPLPSGNLLCTVVSVAHWSVGRLYYCPTFNSSLPSIFDNDPPPLPNIFNIDPNAPTNLTIESILSSLSTPSTSGTTKVSNEIRIPNLIEQAQHVLETLLRDLGCPETNYVPERLPVSIQSPEPEPPKQSPCKRNSVPAQVSDGSSMNSESMAELSEYLESHLTADSSNVPRESENVTKDENITTNKEGSGSSEIQTSRDLQNKPNENPDRNERDSIQSRNNDPNAGSSEKCFSIPVHLQRNNKKNKGLPSMALSVEGVKNALDVLISHINYFARCIISKCNNPNTSPNSWAFFNLAYDTFKEEEYAQVMEILDISRTGLEWKGISDTKDLYARQGDIDNFLKRLHYAYFLIRMYQMSSTKVRDTRTKITELEKIVRSNKEWKREACVNSSDSE